MSYPKVISIYKKSDGIICQILTVSEESALNISEDFGYVDGSYEKGKYKVENDKVIAYTPNYISGTNSGNVREERNRRLLQSDWTQLPDSPLSDSKKTEWATYRQQLRDMMGSYTDSENNTVENTTFPTQPSKE